MKRLFIMVILGLLLVFIAVVGFVYLTLPKAHLYLPTPNEIDHIEITINYFEKNNSRGMLDTVDIRDKIVINKFYQLVNPKLGALGAASHPAMMGQHIKIYTKSKKVIHMTLKGNQIMIVEGKINSNLDVGVFHMNDSEIVELKNILNLSGTRKNGDR